MSGGNAMVKVVPCSKSDGVKGEHTFQAGSDGVIKGTGGRKCPYWVPPGVDPDKCDSQQQKEKNHA